MAKKRVKATKMWAYAAEGEKHYHAVRPELEMLLVQNAPTNAIHPVVVLDARDHREMKAELNRLRKIIVHVEANACLGCRTRLGNAFAYAGAKKWEAKR